MGNLSQWKARSDEYERLEKNSDVLWDKNDKTRRLYT